MFNIEIEKKFLAAHIPAEIHNAHSIRLFDVYFPDDPTKEAHLRARKANQNFKLTKKIPVIGSHSTAHLETTIALEPAEFASITKGHTRIIEKDRYNIDLHGHRTQVDVFIGKLAGLVLIEISFEDEIHMRGFKPPSCCGPEVTNEDFIIGGLLAACTYDDIRPHLDRLGYRPVH
ncbi:hypothetical protein [Corynebacterium freiburgense]|uniref:hypothetical protein n=1 Tax=Corynebacterium freiburgense TaxID=556548 RepID=UPI0003FE5B41|nr:hypothetical protein [Corynebacterium freiburgense]WJZ01366.1 hypothetical protein CFREI_00245 [Corynebacterium freiburgense]